MTKRKTISILGCGWLGLPLAERLLTNGYRVKGTTTTPDKLKLLSEKGILPYLINLKQDSKPQHVSEFLQSDYLVIAFPPGIRAGHGDNYLLQLNTLVKYLVSAPIQHILFISSTSVYPELNKIVTEAEDLTAYIPQNILLQAEALINGLKNNSNTILRFGGLVGGNRHPGRFLAGKENVANPLAPVNLIHLDDCLAIAENIIGQNTWGEIYNACADEHPTRQAFYTAAALKLNLPPPHFAEQKQPDSFKIISSEKLKKELPYRFIHPNPMLFI